MKGFKATDKDMKCRGYQFEIGKWHETKEPLELCDSGFHFCKYPSGVFSYYNVGCRVFEVEAEGILEAPVTPGADYKLVCSKIKFLREIFPDGNANTGKRNTGYGNTGNLNTGNLNTGYGNTGYDNTGDGNTGDHNTGDGNTGNRNTGNLNTGYGNTGYGNTGDRNTGDRNTGDGNTGNRNTGFFCQKEAEIFCFDKNTGMSHEEFVKRHPEYRYLLDRLFDGEIDWEQVKTLPGISKKKLKSLLETHRNSKKEAHP